MATDLPPVSDTVTQATINAYAELSGDFNPLHVDEEIAAASEFGGTIAHGPIALQALLRTLTEGLGVDALPPGSRVAVTYRAPVRPGDAVTAGVQAPGQDGARVALCTNQDGVTVLSGTVALPAEPSPAPDVDGTCPARSAPVAVPPPPSPPPSRR